jgi:hypothetical protein
MHRNLGLLVTHVLKYVMDIFCPLVAKGLFFCGYKQEHETNHLCYNVEV